MKAFRFFVIALILISASSGATVGVCPRLFSGISTEGAKVQALIARIRSSKMPAQFAKTKKVKVYRGLEGELAEFNPVAHEYRPGEGELFVTTDRSYAARYARGGYDRATGSRGYVLEMNLPETLFVKGRLIFDLNRIPGGDLSPFIRRIGVIRVGQIPPPLPVGGKLTRRKLENVLLYLKTRGNLAARTMKIDPRHPERIARGDLKNLNEHYTEEFVNEQIEKDNPKFIRWIRVR